MDSAIIIRHDRKAIILWLSLCALLVAAMVLVGGYTRLSGSGLSITEWKPLHGAIPPLSEAAWQEEFDAYKQTPQYAKINKGMSLEEFEVIFWPEFLHRLLARAIGIVFFIPLVIFALRRSISKPFLWRLMGVFALGGVQGLVGWLMVASGLVNDPHVSHIRLAIHLSLAFLIFACILWALLDVIPAKAGIHASMDSSGGDTLDPGLRRGDGIKQSYQLWFAALCIQIILGAFLAGLHGGLIYNTWPDMDGHFAPPDLLAVSPWWENIPLIQFMHRTLAVIVALGLILWWFLHRAYVKNRHLGKVCSGATAIVAIQFALGVATLLNQVPLPLALAHQMTALLLFAMGVILLHRLRKSND